MTVECPKRNQTNNLNDLSITKRVLHAATKAGKKTEGIRKLSVNKSAPTTTSHPAHSPCWGLELSSVRQQIQPRCHGQEHLTNVIDTLVISHVFAALLLVSSTVQGRVEKSDRAATHGQNLDNPGPTKPKNSTSKNSNLLPLQQPAICHSIRIWV